MTTKLQKSQEFRWALARMAFIPGGNIRPLLDDQQGCRGVPVAVGRGNELIPLFDDNGRWLEIDVNFTCVKAI